MTNEKRKALVEDYRVYAKMKPFPGPYATAADQIEADGQRIAELEVALRGLLGMWSTRTVDYARAALGDKTDD